VAAVFWVNPPQGFARPATFAYHQLAQEGKNFVRSGH
jgi:hypothetical protein